MSNTEKDKKTKKIVFLILVLVLFGILTSCFKQINSYIYTNKKLAEKEKELKALESKNQALKARLEIIKKPEFPKEQARKIFGINLGNGITFRRPTSVPPNEAGRATADEEITNFEKWKRLFIY